MKRLLTPPALALTLVLCGACVNDQRPTQPTKKSGFHPPTPVHTQHTTETTETVERPEKPEKPPEKPEKPANPVPEAPVSVGELPYGKPVPGKPGFVFSPYDQYKGYIDVRGFPPGTEVKDPISEKHFLVP